MTDIHPSAIVEDGASLGEGVVVGPFCHVGPHARLHDGVRLVSHVSVVGRTTLGPRTVIYPFAAVGHPPQARAYKDEPSELIIGADCVIREHATLHPGTEFGRMRTVVGDNCLFMVGTHIAHDCIVGDNVVMANNATLGGHVEVGAFANIGGLAAIHQFVRIGAHAMIGGMSGVEGDVIPFGLVMGDRARLCGLNLVGLKRRGFPREVIQTMRSAYGVLFTQQGAMEERVAEAAETFKNVEQVMN